jgi:protein TonB
MNNPNFNRLLWCFTALLWCLCATNTFAQTNDKKVVKKNQSISTKSDKLKAKPVSTTKGTSATPTTTTTTTTSTTAPTDSSNTTDSPLLVAEQMPEFPGGQVEMMKFVQSTLKYPPMARVNHIQGTVAVRFVVDTQGNVKAVEVIRGIGGGCDQEAIRIIQAMPTWKPGKHKGKTVAVYFTLPVKFKLEE